VASRFETWEEAALAASHGDNIFPLRVDLIDGNFFFILVEGDVNKGYPLSFGYEKKFFDLIESLKNPFNMPNNDLEAALSDKCYKVYTKALEEALGNYVYKDKGDYSLMPDTVKDRVKNVEKAFSSHQEWIKAVESTAAQYAKGEPLTLNLMYEIICDLKDECQQTWESTEEYITGWRPEPSYMSVTG